MSLISPSILAGLSTLVDEKLNYVCLVEYDKIKWYLGLGRRQFYFISEDLTKYKDPPIPYMRINVCRLCTKAKTLVQLKLKIDSKVADSEHGSLDHQMSSTYGNDGLLNFYSLDRATTVDSFKCYW
jgi:hypothetical protein